MVQVSPKTPRDRGEALPVAPDTELLVMPDLDGNLSLEASNLFKNWRLDQLKDDNDPVGLRIGMPEDYDGFSILMSEVDRGTDTLAEQNTESIDPDDDVYVIDELFYPGEAPRSKAQAAAVAPPEGFSLVLVDQANNGLKDGVYKLTYSWFKGKTTTNVAPLLTVTGVLLGNWLLVTLPTDPPDGATHIGLWMTRPNGGFSSLRLQAKIPIRHRRPTTHMIKRFKSRGKSSSKNETVKNSPKQPKLKKVPGKRRAVPGQYNVRIAALDEETQIESELSPPSDTIVITEAEAAAGLNLQIVPEEQGDPTFSYAVYVTDASGTEQRLGNGDAGSLYSPFSASDEPPITGMRTQAQARADQLPSSGENTTTKRETKASTSTSSSSSTGTGENTGLDDPTSPLEQVEVTGKPDIVPGDYWVAVAGVIGEEKTVPATPRQISVTTGKAIQVNLPHAILASRNGNFTDLDKNGKPDAWSLTGAGGGAEGTAIIDDLDRMVLSTNGSKTTGVTPHLWQDFPVNRDMPYTVVGEFAATVSTGTIEIKAIELDDLGAQIGAATTLVTIAASGNYIVEKKFGAGGQAFQDGTSNLRMDIQFIGSPRNSSLAIEEFNTIKHTRRLRRRDRPKPGERRHSSPTTLAGVRYRNGSDKGVELPPQRFRVTTEVTPLDRQNFDTGAYTGWTARDSNPTDTTQGKLAVELGAVTPANYGLRVIKNTTSSRFKYIWKQYGSSTTKQLFQHFHLYINVLPDRDAVTVMQIRPSQADGYNGGIVAIQVQPNGNIELVCITSSNHVDRFVVASGAQAGDTWDIELGAKEATTSKGYGTASAAKLGQSRISSGDKGPYNWSGRAARTVQAGVSRFANNSTLCGFGFDNFVITDAGDVSGASGSSVIGNLPTPDRPLKDPGAVFASDLESAPASPLSLTAGASHGAFGIPSGNGVRVTKSSSTDQYIEYLEAAALPGRGYRARLRVVTRPTTGNVGIARVMSDAGMVMGRIYIDSAGDLYAQTYKVGGTQNTLKKISSAVANGTVLTLDMVPDGGGTVSGSFDFWLAVGDTGLISERSLAHQDSAIDWTGHLVRRARWGGMQESVSGANVTLDVDNILVTNEGETVYQEFDADGNEVYGLHVFYPQGQPARDDLWVQDLFLPCLPGEIYKLAVEHRIANMADVGHPFHVTAYDTKGNEYALGGVYGSSGVTGTVDWADKVQPYSIPLDCYKVKIHSLNIGAGEYACQRIFWGRTDEDLPTREITFPASNTFRIVLDSETAEQYLLWSFYPENVWLSLKSIANMPEGTSVQTVYQSSDIDTQPASWFANPAAVPQRRYAHFKVTMNASDDFKRSPELPSGSPNLEYWTRAGALHLATLLREDMSEFPGGVYAYGVDFPAATSDYDIREPQGKTRRHRRYAPVGKFEELTLYATSEEAQRELRENWTKLHVLETDDRRAVIKFKEPIIWSNDYETKRKIRGKWYMYAEAQIGQTEIATIDWIPGLASIEAMGA